MKMKKSLSYLLIIAGVLLIIAGLGLMLIIVPAMTAFPNDVDEIRQYNLEYLILLNADTLQFFRAAPGENPNLFVRRHVQVEAVDGSKTLVRENQDVMNGDELLFPLEYRYVLDRKTLQPVEDFPQAWAQRPGYWLREGVVIGWPIGAKKKNYRGWSEDYRHSVDLIYVREEEHGGINTYYYTSERPPEALAPAHVETLRLPVGLTPQQLAGLASGIQVEGVEVSLAARLRLLQLIQDAVAATQEESSLIPLVYFYDYRGEYWVEPTTGVLIDTIKYEHRTATFPPEILEYVKTTLENTPQDPQANNYLPPDILEKLLPITVNEFIYQAAPGSVDDARNDAEDAIQRVRMYGRYLPLGLMVMGAGLGAGGVYQLRKAFGGQTSDK